ncbi:putative LRR receptor-like serine/threonine-protein kinase RFK1 isoform X2 [Apium graveolens]|uniref:putative LRR receptor-like serine/threonine-protein kinase RFK1 isoform X2 n=1 Tax=Apium graveolens TaxID=4045 RepID=UPI003D79632F
MISSMCLLPAMKSPCFLVDALQQLTSAMGATYWKFDAEFCRVEMAGINPQAPPGSENAVVCECNSDTICHVVTITLKGLALPGVLPSELEMFPYLRKIDFAYNYLRGTIPLDWGSTTLQSVSVLANRLSGEVPKELGNIATLTYLNLEANQFSGTIPPELGKLSRLENLILSSNRLTGSLPLTFAELTNLTDFRINDNNFTGPIPEFIQSWTRLDRLEMSATGLEGPIPSSISSLDNLTDLRITDIHGPIQRFPNLSISTNLIRLVLRNCNISGEVPTYIWKLEFLELVDVSYNKLVGEIPNRIESKRLKFLYLMGNMLSGNVPDSILRDGMTIDLSYNNFTWQGPEQPTCQPNRNLYINLFKSSYSNNTLKDILPCAQEFTCPRYGCSLRVNSGGENITIKETNGEVLYEGDAGVEGGAARYYKSNNYWGFSSSGDFMDDNNYQNSRYVKSVPSINIPEMYTTARLSPVSLTYFRYCLDNGSYDVSLHFAEIQFTNDNTSNSLGRRIFDIYIQDILVWKDFDIENEAHGAQRPLVKRFNASVTNTILEIRFYFAGRGTTRIPNRGVYGPIISAISAVPNFKICYTKEKKRSSIIYVIVGVLTLGISTSIVAILWWKGCFKGKKRKGKDFGGVELKTVSFSLKQLKVATNNFNSTNKLGEGGFGPVYKGLLPDGTVIAVKQLSSRSRQGDREFLNEIAMISCLQHPNLVKLYGCCIEGNQLLLVYEYLENNSLAKALFGSGNSQLILDWPTRYKIGIGIARGLAFLHEESRLKIVHRDIKGTNVLLDGELNPKISDFGLARLNEDEKSHISTRVAGTIGYMAPEYALWGYLSDKADVYSFGVVILEIVSGKNNNSYMPSNNCICLLDWACKLQETKNFEELIDPRLGSEVIKDEAERMVKVALLCTNASPSLRPIMSEVVAMLEERQVIPDTIPEANDYSNDLRFKAMRDFYRDQNSRNSHSSQTLSHYNPDRTYSSVASSHSFTGSQTLNVTQAEMHFSSTSSADFNEIHQETKPQ